MFERDIATKLDRFRSTGKGWTAIPFVAEEINHRITGHEKRDCFDFFALKHPGRRFKRVLFLNRTDLWLEHRLYYDLMLFESGVAIHERHLPLPDFNSRYSNANASAVMGGKNRAGEIGVWFNALSQHHRLAVWRSDLETAQAAWLAQYGHLISESVLAIEPAAEIPIRRVQMLETSDSVELPNGPFDLVVNYLGAQAITRPDRTLRAICRQMAPDGVMMNFDYVGPHRYQYPEEQWKQVIEINRHLPEWAVQTLVYPRLSAMLERDPTDAVSSELTLATMKRYFTLQDFRPAGGALAHPLLSENEKLFGFVAGLEDVVADVMASDWDYLCEHPESTLLAYWTAKPNFAALDDSDQLAEYSREEERRELRAREKAGYYYPETSLHRTLYPRDRLTSEIKRLRRSMRNLLRRPSWSSV